MNKHVISAILTIVGALVVAGCNKACVDKDALEPKFQRVLCIDADSQKLVIDVEVDPKTIRHGLIDLEYIDNLDQKWSWFTLGVMPCAVTDTIAVTQARQVALKARTPQPAAPAPATALAPTDAGPATSSDAGPAPKPPKP